VISVAKPIERHLCFWSLFLVLTVAPRAFAQLAPEIGYAVPSGGQIGKTVDITLGGYDWTPDMQLLVRDPRVQLSIAGPSTEVLTPDPPFWFGAKGRGYAWPLSREFPAKLTIAPDMPPGLIKWQAANANGVSPPGVMHISPYPEVVEETNRKSVQELPTLPLVVNGQIKRIEEIDVYTFKAEKAGPVTIELIARRLNSPLHGVLTVRDPSGKALVDVADTEGHDFTVTFAAEANTPYTLRLHDVDYAGDRSYAYRLQLTTGARVLAAYPASGKRGETIPVQFVGYGLATGKGEIESITKNVTFPTIADSQFSYSLETPLGPTAFSLGLSDVAEQVEPLGAQSFTLPSAPTAVTASIENPLGSDIFDASLVAATAYEIVAKSMSPSTPVDLEIAILGADGKELAYSDDMPKTVDPVILFTPPADGLYRIVVTDRSAKTYGQSANYRLSVGSPRPDFTLGPNVPSQLSVPLGTAVKLPLQIARAAGFTQIVNVAVSGLPAGITVPPDLKIAENAADLPIDLTCAADAAADAKLVTFTLTGTAADGSPRKVEHQAVIAATMKPRLKITPEGLDDVRRIQRGSTYLGPLYFNRIEGYSGPVTIEMTSKQQRHRQGLRGEEMEVPADVTRFEYPIFVPEWMETTKTSRMIINGVVRIPDPKGNMRTLVQQQELRLGLLPVGAQMKLAAEKPLIKIKRGATVEISLALTKAPEFKEVATIGLHAIDIAPGERITADKAQNKSFSVTPVEAAAAGLYRVSITAVDDEKLVGEHTVILRASAMQGGKYLVAADVVVTVIVE
jgi:hypothetical protein